MAGITPYTENSWKKTNYDRIISKTPEEMQRPDTRYVQVVHYTPYGPQAWRGW